MNVFDDDIKKYIEKAKEKVMNDYGRMVNRRWLDVFVDSYESNRERIRLLVWEGSPAKGYIIINYGTGSIMAFDVNDKLLKKYNNANFLNDALDVAKGKEG